MSRKELGTCEALCSLFLFSFRSLSFCVLVWYYWEGAGVVGSNLNAATFLRVRGTMSGNESSSHKCPVLERLG